MSDEDIYTAEMRKRMDSLTPHRREILILAAQHFSSKDIARMLGIKPSTVDNHMAAIVRQLGVSNRREAAVLAMDLGLTSGLPDPRASSVTSGNRYRDAWYTRRHVLRPQGLVHRFLSIFRDRNDTPKGGENDGRGGGSNEGVSWAILRFAFDAFYILVFFAVMSSAAYGVDLIIALWEQRHIDVVVLAILRGVSYVLVVLDAIGVIVATVLLTSRFVLSFWRSLWRSDD